MDNSIVKLKEVQKESVFTVGLDFEVFISELCGRYARIYGEILPIKDYDYIFKKLSQKGII